MSSRIAVILLMLAAVLAFGLFGLQRSLWTDEAWVANSVREPTLGGMFYYPGWLQTSPPLFLLLERGAVAALGLSNTALRVVPLAAEIVAVAVVFFALRRMVPLPYALLGAMIVACQPVAIEYSRTCKQYSGEMAASAALIAATSAHLSDRSRRTFRVLMLTTLVALPLAYPSIFLIPGVAAAVWATGEQRRAITLSAFAGVVLVLLYSVFIQPNYSPALREFWAESPVWSGGMIATLAICAAALARFGTGSSRQWMYCVCAVPGLLLAGSSVIGWYPATTRTWLFVLPCLVIPLMMLAAEFLPDRTSVHALVWSVALAIPLLAAWRQVHQHRNQPEEDFAGAVRFLRQHAAPSDLLLIHPSVKEGFELYAAMEGFGTPQPIYGATGWPCCVRGHLASRHSSSREAVIDDLESKIPRGFAGRVWLVYSSRPTQWDYTGLDEGNLWRSQAWAMGCPPDEFHAFANVALSPMFCTSRR